MVMSDLERQVLEKRIAKLQEQRAISTISHDEASAIIDELMMQNAQLELELFYLKAKYEGLLYTKELVATLEREIGAVKDRLRPFEILVDQIDRLRNDQGGAPYWKHRPSPTEYRRTSAILAKAEREGGHP